MTNADKMRKNLLVLDLDETLIHGTEKPLDRDADFRIRQFHIYKRPKLAEFLQACSHWYELAVWSSGSDLYVRRIVDEIFQNPENLVFVWGESRTKTRKSSPEDYEQFGWEIGEYHYQKPLKRLECFGWPLENTLIIDDSREKCASNYGNAIYPDPYEGSLDDNELDHLARYLHSIRDIQNYRTIEKRNWRRDSASNTDFMP